VCDQLKTHVSRRVQTLTADVMGLRLVSGIREWEQAIQTE